MNVSAPVVRCKARPRSDGALRECFKELTERYARYGYSTLRHEEPVKNRSRTYRNDSEELAQV